MIGTLYDSKTLFLRQGVGDAQDTEDNSYELSLVNFNVPCVRSARTNKFFTLAWSEIIGLAREAGIDNED